MRLRNVALFTVAVAVIIAVGFMQDPGSNTVQPARAEAATGPAFSPWPEVRSVNTNPQAGWVIAMGREEGREIVAVCSGTNLIQGAVTFDGTVGFSVVDQAWMCLPGASSAEQATPAADDPTSPWLRGRPLNTSPKQGWAILSGPMGQEIVGVCQGDTLVAGLLLESGELEEMEYPGAPPCASNLPVNSAL